MHSTSRTHVSVEELMTKNPVSVNVSGSIQEAVDSMFDHDIRHIPVVKDGTLVGMISDRDVKSFAFSSSDQNEAQDDDSLVGLHSPVSEVLQNDVVFVTPETTVPEVIDLMIDHKIGAVPVVEEQNNQLIGIVSYVDILRAASEYF